MVMTRSVGGEATTGQGDPPRRVVARPPALPGPRAVVGGLLVALAGVGTFLSWQQAAGAPDGSYAVAAHPLRPGDPVTADAVRFEPVELPGSVAAAAFPSLADLEGRVLVAPVGEGELVQRGVVSDPGEAVPAAEVSVALPRDRAVDGRLQAGDTVDVYATGDGGTSAVAVGVRIIAVTDGGGSLGAREVTVTLALVDPAARVPVIHAARRGEITLVRTTHAGGAAAGEGAGPSGAPPGSPGPQPGGGG